MLLPYMWPTSNRLAFSRVQRWLSPTLRSAYCTGIEYPAKGTILPPWATWRSWRPVRRSGSAAEAAYPRGPGGLAAWCEKVRAGGSAAVAAAVAATVPGHSLVAEPEREKVDIAEHERGVEPGKREKEAEGGKEGAAACCKGQVVRAIPRLSTLVASAIAGAFGTIIAFQAKLGFERRGITQRRWY